MLIDELPEWIFNELPESITPQSLMSELRDINLPINVYNARYFVNNADELPPKKILEFANKNNKISLPKSLNQKLQEVVKAIDTSKGPSYSQKFLEEIKTTSKEPASQKVPPAQSHFKSPNLGLERLESISDTDSEMSDTQLLELDISAEEVKKIADSEFHSMIDQLANNQKKVKISDLPVHLQKLLEAKNKAKLPRVKIIEKAELDMISGKPGISGKSSKTLVPDVLKDMAKHARRKSIVYKKDPHPSLIPASVNTIEKIIDRCHEKVTQSLLDTLKHLPNKPVKFEKLPQVVLEELEKQGLISIPQNYGDILLDYKRRQSSVATIRLTKSSLDDSVSKLSENTKGAASHKHSTRKSGAAAANLIQVSTNLVPPLSPNTAVIHTANPSNSQHIPTIISSKRRGTALIEPSNKNLDQNFSKRHSRENSVSGLTPRTKSRQFERRFSKGDFAPGFVKVDMPKEEDKREEELKQNKVAQSAKNLQNYKFNKRKTKIVTERSDVTLIGISPNLNRRNTVSSLLVPRFNNTALATKSPSNPFAK